MSTKQAKMLELRKEGLDATEIAGKLKTSRGYVQNVLSKHGATRRRRRPFRRQPSTFADAVTALRARARHFRKAAEASELLAKKLEQVVG